MKSVINLIWLSSVSVSFLPTLLLHGILMCGYGPTRGQAFQMIVIVPLIGLCGTLLSSCFLPPERRKQSFKLALAWIPYVGLGWLYYDKFLNDMGYGLPYAGGL
jgi:hypothetical protein